MNLRFRKGIIGTDSSSWGSSSMFIGTVLVQAIGLREPESRPSKFLAFRKCIEKTSLRRNSQMKQSPPVQIEMTPRPPIQLVDTFSEQGSSLLSPLSLSSLTRLITRSAHPLRCHLQIRTHLHLLLNIRIVVTQKHGVYPNRLLA